jgi:chaperonin GroEL (HSP60 family)
VELRKAHENGDKYAGVNVFSGKVENMKDIGVLEPLRVKKQAISSATEVAIMILRIDDVIAAKGIESEKEGEGGESEESESESEF